MRSQELRSALVDFFAARGHKRVPSASLIPDAMSTTLFTIAGMEQFVPVFLGREPAPAPRVVTVQRCLRVAGAKSDIENVGRTGRHGTFLEMLGNFSFGDYYKREAIALGVGVRHRACSSSIRHGSTSPFTPATTKPSGSGSTKSASTGRRITRFDEENFWTMGPTGPCGPCTEIFYDTGARVRERPRRHRPEHRQPLRRDLERRLPAVQPRAPTASLTELPRKPIDTGAGLERMLAVCNGVASMYETDSSPIWSPRSRRSGKRRSHRTEQLARRNIIADHAARGDVPDQRRRLPVEYRSRLRAAVSDSPRDPQRKSARLSRTAF